MFFSFSLFAQTEIITLEPGKPLEREIAGGETHNFKVPLNDGQFLKLIVDQNLVVAVAAFAPDGTKIIEKDSFGGNRGLETILLIAETTGDYRIEVQSLQKNVPPGKYVIKIDELRAATPKDIPNVKAQELAADAGLLRKQAERKTRKRARRNYKNGAGKICI